MEDVQTYILERTAGKVAKRPKPIVRTDNKQPSAGTQKKFHMGKRATR